MMHKFNISRLERNEGLREFLYHIKGLIEAGENLSELVTKLNRAYERSAADYARTTSEIEVETFDHIGYHIKKLRRPLAEIQREAYATLDESENNDKGRGKLSGVNEAAKSRRKASK